ncbi:MAG TPA: lipase maturation factor family protein [Geomonas sp.]|nr:lipase maturation factor family protein [Geomonas sp.]
MRLLSQQFLPWLFPRLLGVVYFSAFFSLLVQVRGLFGANGILPITGFLAALRAELEKPDYLDFPTLFWLKSSDQALVGGCLAGLILSILLIAGAPPVPLLILLWLLYLSYVAVGQDFLAYQWDSLLLEVGFMTIFLPLASPAPPLVVFTYRFFLFRFMISAGAVKLLSRDPTWRDLTALTYHYQTQPIPNRPAWYAHQLPLSVQKLSTLVTLLLELGAPVLALGPEPARLACLVLMILLQLLIAGTGNYGFFNLLTVVMCLPLLDDRLLGSFLELPQAFPNQPAAVAVSAIFGIFLILNLCQLVLLFHRPRWLLRPLMRLSPFMISNHYGLFAVMTTDRLELVVEGSMDGSGWQEYEFRWKPGDPKRPPRQAAPHMPRLDWQMWFAALAPNRLEPWLQNFLVRLLQGQPEVLALLADNPFPSAPPTYIRVSVYRYTFSDYQKRSEQSTWWERTLIGRFQPIKLHVTKEEK